MRDDVLIVGSGAVATLFAVRLGLAGHSVSMLATWQAAADVISEQGVKAIHPDGHEETVRVNIVQDPGKLAEVRDAIVLVKSWQTQRAARQLSGVLAEDGIALTLQNGMGNREILAGTLGSQRAASGVMVLGAQLLAPGVVKATPNPGVQLEVNPRLDNLRRVLDRSGFSVEVHRNLTVLQWKKLIVNAAINPLSAVLGVANGDLLLNLNAYDLLLKLTLEAQAIAEAAGVNLDEEPVVLVRRVIEKTYENHSSMLQDRLRGAPTEIEEINGYLVGLSEALSIDAPLNRCFLSLLRALTFQNATIKLP